MTDLISGNEFYDMLNDSDNEDEEMCLISHQPLDNTLIKMPCGHKFNYYPLYKEIYNQKKKPSSTEITRLRPYQTKCPYCRTIHNFLIPHRNLNGVELVYGVNSPRKYVYYEHKCKYVFKRGKNKGETCSIRCMDEYCINHQKKMNSETVGSTSIKNKVLGCKYVLTKGTNKGKCCKNKAGESGFCYRHNNLFEDLNTNLVIDVSTVINSL